MEIWKQIKGYEGLYEISSCGRVKNKKGTILKPSVTRTGYPHLSLCKNGKTKSVSVHRIVAEHFIPNPNNYPVINHKDENRQNNTVENLEWCTYSYNASYGDAPIKNSKSMKKYFARDVNPNRVKVRCIDTGEIFDSIIDASEKYHIDQSSITKVCKKKPKRKTAGGFRWEYEITGETEC